jgi:transcriptional regulator GlxA family with amidase domain
MKTVGIFLFDQVEVLDFAGPFEVFSVASQLAKSKEFKVITFSSNDSSITAVNGLSVNPTFGIADLPQIDYLVIPGGDGTKKVIVEPQLLKQLESLIEQSKWTMTVCSGSRIPAKLGLLDSKPFCTHHSVYDSIAAISPSAIPKPELRFTQSALKLYTAAGISAGIDLSFFLLENSFGKALALETAHYMEYLSYPASK